MASASGAPLSLPPRRSPDIDDDFRTGVLGGTWVPHYLPHWTTPERSRARTSFSERGLELRIDADQPEWRPEDAPLRVSNVQTGTFSGPQGSTRGTHRHRSDGLVVRTAVPTRLPFAPESGRVDVTLHASTDPDCMTAIWLVGTEHRDPRDSGEICVVEIDAHAVGAQTTVRCGIKAHDDDRLATEMVTTSIPHDASGALTWTVIWAEGRTVIGCEGATVHIIDQAPTYPLILMIDIFESRAGHGVYPKSAAVQRVRAWSS